MRVKTGREEGRAAPSAAHGELGLLPEDPCPRSQTERQPPPWAPDFVLKAVPAERSVFRDVCAWPTY